MESIRQLWNDVVAFVRTAPKAFAEWLARTLEAFKGGAAVNENDERDNDGQPVVSGSAPHAPAAHAPLS